MISLPPIYYAYPLTPYRQTTERPHPSLHSIFLNSPRFRAFAQPPPPPLLPHLPHLEIFLRIGSDMKRTPTRMLSMSTYSSYLSLPSLRSFPLFALILSMTTLASIPLLLLSPLFSIYVVTIMILVFKFSPLGKEEKRRVLF
ncbi:hypothetical protein VNO78_14889 [Psophocarpus tetragonolobus]|uniref:Transmembrane protein n=1 Tax=Psophocarpus tetragonolobus TaxID=3891 RepID=A0AAN9XJ89_PSOTE